MDSVVRVPLTKHVACDRCRRLKVRCSRGELHIHPCTRCQHAGIPCTTSEPKPRGRPCTASKIARRNKVAVTPKGLGSSDPFQTEHCDYSPLQNFGETPTTCPWPRWDVNHDAFLDQEFDDWSSDRLVRDLMRTPTDAFHALVLPQQSDEDVLLNKMPSLLLPTMFDEALELQADTMLVEPHSRRSRDLESPYTQHLLDTSVISPFSKPSEARAKDNQLQHRPHSHRNTQSSLGRLAKINEDIARHLDIIGTYIPGMESLHSLCHNLLQQSTVHPLIAILNTTSDFLSLLRSMSTSSGSNSSLHPEVQMTANAELSSSTPTIEADLLQSNSAPASSSSMNTATILMMLAGRLQLIHLYDNIFRRANDFLSALPYDQTCLHHALAGLEFGNLITDVRLRMKIVVQVVEHHLEQIEKLMDLPPEYRLYEQRLPFQGIVRQWTSSALLRTIIMQTGEKSDDLASLKRHLQGVKQALQV